MDKKIKNKLNLKIIIGIFVSLFLSYYYYRLTGANSQYYFRSGYRILGIPALLKDVFNSLIFLGPIFLILLSKGYADNINPKVKFVIFIFSIYLTIRLTIALLIGGFLIATIGSGGFL